MAAGAALAAAEPRVNFRYEYVSGVVYVFNNESAVEIHVASRGATGGVFRAFLFQLNATTFDSGDIPVHPGTFSSTYFRPSPGDLGLTWGRILTTSANLVPSMRCWRTSPLFEKEAPVLDVYFAPGDFAVFELPFFASQFPIGPAEGA